jgi:hypothetical protein
MSRATVTRFKFFFPDQDVEQEQWLRAMALKGLHLQKLNMLQLWTFARGEPADMVYRVDFNNGSAKPDYRQLLEDAGWERAACLSGWQYWRTRSVDGRSPELFTDAASKAAKFKRLMTLLFVCSLPSVFLFASPSMRHALSSSSWPFLAVIVGAFGLNLVGMARLVARLVRVRREQV